MDLEEYIQGRTNKTGRNLFSNTTITTPFHDFLQISLHSLSIDESAAVSIIQIGPLYQKILDL